MNTPALLVFGFPFTHSGSAFSKLQDIRSGNSLVPLSRVTRPLATGFSSREFPTVFITSLPIIGYRLSCFSLNVGSTGSSLSRPETNTYDWWVSRPNVPTTANVYAFLTSSSVTPAFNLALTCICTAGLTLAVLTPNPYEYLLNLLSVLVTAWIKSGSLLFPLNVSRISRLYSLLCLISKVLKYVNLL